jgi:importin subunit beta-1
VFLINSSDDWGLSKASCCLLSGLSRCCDYELITEVMNFIGTNINNPSFLNKEAGLLAFGAILETQHKESLVDTVLKSIDILLEYLAGQTTVTLKDTCAWVLERVAETYGEYLDRNEHSFDKWFEAIITLMSSSTKKNVVYLTNTLHYIFKGLRPNENQNSNVLSKYVKGTLDLLIKLAFYPDSYDTEFNVSLSAFFCISSVVEYCAPDCKFIINAFFEQLIEGMKSTLEVTNYPNTVVRQFYQENLANNISSALLTGYVNLDNESSKMLFDLIVNTFSQRSNVYQEGIMAISALATYIGPSFDFFMPSYLNYLVYALNSTSEVELCRTSINATSEIIRALDKEFAKHLDKVLPIILSILGNLGVDRSLKPYCFNIITDTIVTCKEASLVYFNETINLMASALEAAAYITNDEVTYVR